MNERRVNRIQELIKERVAEVLDRDIADPRRGLITVTRVKVDREMQSCLVFWSILGDAATRKRNARMLADARSFVQKEVAAVLRTRTVPRVKFVFDESIEGAQRIQGILTDLAREREDREVPADAGAADADAADAGAADTGAADTGDSAET